MKRKFPGNVSSNDGPLPARRRRRNQRVRDLVEETGINANSSEAASPQQSGAAIPVSLPTVGTAAFCNTCIAPQPRLVPSTRPSVVGSGIRLGDPNHLIPSTSHGLNASPSNTHQPSVDPIRFSSSFQPSLFMSGTHQPAGCIHMPAATTYPCDSMNTMVIPLIVQVTYSIPKFGSTPNGTHFLPTTGSGPTVADLHGPLAPPADSTRNGPGWLPPVDDCATLAHELPLAESVSANWPNANRQQRSALENSEFETEFNQLLSSIEVNYNTSGPQGSLGNFDLETAAAASEHPAPPVESVQNGTGALVSVNNAQLFNDAKLAYSIPQNGNNCLPSVIAPQKALDNVQWVYVSNPTGHIQNGIVAMASAHKPQVSNNAKLAPSIPPPIEYIQNGIEALPIVDASQLLIMRGSESSVPPVAFIQTPNALYQPVSTSYFSDGVQLVASNQPVASPPVSRPAYEPIINATQPENAVWPQHDVRDTAPSTATGPRTAVAHQNPGHPHPESSRVTWDGFANRPQHSRRSKFPRMPNRRHSPRPQPEQGDGLTNGHGLSRNTKLVKAATEPSGDIPSGQSLQASSVSSESTATTTTIPCSSDPRRPHPEFSIRVPVESASASCRPGAHTPISQPASCPVLPRSSANSIPASSDPRRPQPEPRFGTRGAVSSWLGQLEALMNESY